MLDFEILYTLQYLHSLGIKKNIIRELHYIIEINYLILNEVAKM